MLGAIMSAPTRSGEKVRSPQRGRPMKLTHALIVIPMFSFAMGYTAEADELPLVYREDFEKGAERWQPFDANQWQLKKTTAGHVFSQFEKRSAYKPPHRSPFNVALLKEVVVGDFVFDGKVLSTHE